MSAPRVYVGKIPRALADDAIVERALEICGALKAWKRVVDPTTRAPKRFGFATFETIEGAVRCARAIDGLRVGEEDEAMTCAANAATKAATTAYLRRAGEDALDADGDERRRREIARVLGRAMEGEEVEVGEISDDEATAKAKAAKAAKATDGEGGGRREWVTAAAGGRGEGARVDARRGGEGRWAEVDVEGALAGERFRRREVRERDERAGDELRHRAVRARWKTRIRSDRARRAVVSRAGEGDG